MTGVFTGVRARLLALLLVASIPVLVTALAGAWEGHRRAMADIVEQATLLREGEAARHGAALADLRGMVTALAGMPALAGLTDSACATRMSEIAALFQGRHGNIWLEDASGARRCETPGQLHPPAQLGPAPAGADYAVGEFIAGEAPDAILLPASAAIRVPAMPGRVGATLRAAWFARDETRLTPGLEHDAWLVDRAGGIFALGGQSPAHLPPPSLLGAWRGAGQALTVLAPGRDGQPFAFSWRPVRDGVSLLVALPAGAAQAAADAQFGWRLAEVLAQIGLCLVALAVGAEMTCARPMRRLAAALHHWQHGQQFTPPAGPWDPWEVTALGGTLAHAARGIASREAALRDMLSERDRMLAEIHHRVKNSLQVAASMLSLHAGFVDDAAAREEIRLAHARVQTLALLHRHLYATAELDDVAMAPLLRDVAAMILDGAGLRWQVAAPDVTLGVEQVTPLTMLLAEALHLTRETATAVQITLRQAAGRMELSVQADAVPPAASILARGRLGVAELLMQGFAAQLGAVLPGHGEPLVISFDVLR